MEGLGDQSAKTFKVGDLPDWLLVEVLCRLPLKDVFRCKRVSKHWLSLITDPSFSHIYVSQELKPERWSFIHDFVHFQDSENSGFPEQRLQNVFFSNDLLVPSFSLVVLPDPPIPNTSCHQIIAIHNGLVLYQFLTLKKLTVDYGICNPITGHCLILPPINYHPHLSRCIKVGFLTTVGGKLRNYKVFRFKCASAPDSILAFEVFCSEIGTWSDFVVSSGHAIPVGSFPLVAFNGMLHWIDFHKHVMVAYDPNNNPDQCHNIELPPDFNRLYSEIILFDGRKEGYRLFQMSMSRGESVFSRVRMWLLGDSGDGQWSLKHELVVTQIMADRAELSGCLSNLESIAFHPFELGTVFFRGNCCSGPIIISLNLETQKLQSHGDIYSSERKVKHLNDGFPWWHLLPYVCSPWPIAMPRPS